MTGSKQRYFDGLTASQRFQVRLRQSKLDALNNEPGVEWRPVEGHPGYYVSNDGRARHDTVILRGTIHPLGYRVVHFKDSIPLRLHRLVARAFLGPIPPDCEVRHLNDVKTDNRVENLAYGTHTENMDDRRRNGNDPQRNRTHCKNGHEYNGANTRWLNSGKRPTRICRACAHAAYKRYAAAKRTAANT